MKLPVNSLLQGGKYRIERELGHGGFGITYLATQTGLNRKVAVKEFFMRDYCERDSETSHVSMGTGNSRMLVEKFRQKFVKEAQTIAEMDNNHIIRIHDIFEENNTAYYVMEYLQSGDLRSRIPSGGMSEDEALGYIRQICDALSYIHSKNILHLDIKPTNILFRNSGEAVLIDFGVSKHYDSDGGSQTSSTPVGVSEGYAPTEQYDGEEISSFSSSTDIYALGATLYCLLSGNRPPKAGVVLNDGLPPLPLCVSSTVRNAVEQAMQPRRKERPQSIDEFLALLDGNGAASEETVFPDEAIVAKVIEEQEKPQPVPTPEHAPSPLKKMLLPIIIVAAALLTFLLWPKGSNEPAPVPSPEPAPVEYSDSTPAQNIVQTPVKNEQAAPPVAPAKEEAPALTQLYVTTSPAGATVYVDGKKAGTSPIEGKEYAQGSHTIKITLDGYKAISTKVKFDEKPVILNKTLEKVEETPAPAKQTAATSGTINGHEWVDLGLSVKWATCNVGASSPSDYGNYYAWGETTTKSEYTVENCKTYDKNIGDIAGNPTYDAARANWGGSWRLPTKAEWQELVNNCTWQWTTQGGKKGYKVTSKKNGYNIFIPASGYRCGSSLYDAGSSVESWSSAPYESDTQSAYFLDFFSPNYFLSCNTRSNGRSVRPVISEIDVQAQDKDFGPLLGL